MKRKVAALLFVVVCLLSVAVFSPANAQSGNQWRVDFFNNPNWVGPVVHTTWTGLISFNWGTGSPGPGVPQDHFTARMTSDVFFFAGVYRFTFLADDEVVLRINGVTHLDTLGRGMSGKNVTVDVPIPQGNHRVEVDFREHTGPAYIFVNWFFVKSDPSLGWSPTPVPPRMPQPSASSVVTQFGDFTPCIQQGTHQANCFRSTGAWDAPNTGSIELEPQIVIWGNCTANTVRYQVLFANRDPQSSVCSRTEAGWFAR